MKAYTLYEVNDLRFEDRKIPELKEHEVLVKVRNVGVCGSDIPRIYKTGAHVYPLIPGHEFSGEIVDDYDEQDGEKKYIGKRVGVFPLIPCGKCVACKKQKYEMCRNYNYLGSRCDGGFAEYVAVPKWNVIELPDNVSFEQAAMLEPMAVAVHAIRRIKIDKNDKVFVLGLGTIGILITMFLNEMDIKNLYVIGNKDFQKKSVLKLDIHEENFCDTRFCNVKQWIMDKTGSEGADVFFECVGKNETIETAIDTAAQLGKIVYVGNPYTDNNLDRSVYWKILRNQLEITGTWNSSYNGDKEDDWHLVLKKLTEKKIKPEMFITHRFGKEQLNKGLEIMRDKTEDYIKVMGEF